MAAPTIVAQAGWTEPVPVALPVQPVHMMVTIPAGCVAGSQFQVQTPQGPVAVVVPQGAAGGMQLQVAMPTYAAMPMQGAASIQPGGYDEIYSDSRGTELWQTREKKKKKRPRPACRRRRS